MRMITTGTGRMFRFSGKVRYNLGTVVGIISPEEQQS